MITELTAEQQARIPEFIEKWTKIGLCADPADRAKAEEGVRLSYRIAGFEPPSKIVWCESPLSMTLTKHIVREYDPLLQDSVLSSVWFAVTASVLSSVRTSVAECVMDSVWHSIWTPLWSSVWRSVRDLIWTSLADTFQSSVDDPVWDSVCSLVPALARDSVRNLINVSFGHPVAGQHAANWIACFNYYRVVCGLTEQTEKMLGVMQVAENSGWWAPYKDVCWISERPNRLKFDDRGRLHCEDGPALSYPDGWSIYAIHGVRVNEQIIMRPRSQGVDVIRNEPIAEVKRIWIERFGWTEYLRAVGAVVLDSRDNDVESTKEALMKTPDGHVVLVCSCPSTARVYCLEVPPGTMTCEAAQDWLSGGLSSRVINGA